MLCYETPDKMTFKSKKYSYCVYLIKEPIHNINYCYRKLKRLNLGGNGLTSVPQKALSILDMLRKLEMQENKITEIREGDFEGR